MSCFISDSPLCFNCKALHPIFNQLAEHYKDNADIVIAKTDAVENEYPQFKFKRYPGIIFFPKDGKPVSSFVIHTIFVWVKLFFTESVPMVDCSYIAPWFKS